MNKLSEILIEIHTFLFNTMRLKMLSVKRRSLCLGLNVLKQQILKMYTIWMQNAPKGVKFGKMLHNRC